MLALEHRHDVERDAMRYRWLRDTQNTPVRGQGDEPAGTICNLFVSKGGGCAEAPSGDELDLAIDVAMFGALTRRIGGC